MTPTVWSSCALLLLLLSANADQWVMLPPLESQIHTGAAPTSSTHDAWRGWGHHPRFTSCKSKYTRSIATLRIAWSPPCACCVRFQKKNSNREENKQCRVAPPWLWLRLPLPPRLEVAQKPPHRPLLVWGGTQVARTQVAVLSTWVLQKEETPR